MFVHKPTDNIIGRNERKREAYSFTRQTAANRQRASQIVNAKSLERVFKKANGSPQTKTSQDVNARELASTNSLDNKWKSWIGKSSAISALVGREQVGRETAAAAVDWRASEKW